MGNGEGSLWIQVVSGEGFSFPGIGRRTNLMVLLVASGRSVVV
jgi:hypothetical protein